MSAEQVLVNKVVEISDSIRMISVAVEVATLDVLVLVVSTLTLYFLIWTTIETRRIANQTVESALRPVILRSGYILKWEDIIFDISDGKLIDSKPLNFKILKNIAKDIEGYIFLKNKKHKLLFANQVTRITETDDGGAVFHFLPIWGWMEPDSIMHAIYDPRVGENSKEEDGLYIVYKDIEGNKYFTREDRNFSQSSGKA